VRIDHLSRLPLMPPSTFDDEEKAKAMEVSTLNYKSAENKYRQEDCFTW